MSTAFPDLEVFYDALAESLDAVPDDKRDLFLTKLALLLSNDVVDPEKLKRALVSARANIE
jgi:hypothetical protein